MGMLIRGIGSADVDTKKKFLAALGVESDLDRPTWPLPNMKEVNPSDFWGWRASHNFKAEAWADRVRIDGEHGTLLLFWLDRSNFENGGFAVVVIYRGTVADEAKYFRWGACDHDFSSQNVGRCLNRYTCKKCGVSHDIDSSD